MRRLVISVSAFLMLVVHALTAFAEQAFSDPTRPSTAVNGVPAAAGIEVETGLQSIILPKSGKPMAVVNGRRVTVGEKIGDEKVTKITETPAWLPWGIQRIEQMGFCCTLLS